MININKNKMQNIIYLSALACSSIFAKDSITANYTGYVETCRQASYSEEILNSFRTIASYRTALEIDEADQFAEYIRGTTYLLPYLEDFRHLDSVGGPFLTDYQDLGLFSPSALRYIFHADQIKKRFSLPRNPKIVEIGAGFGGQSYILQQIHPCAKYYIYDLPEVEGLIDRVMQRLNISNVKCMPLDEELPEEEIDLIISNYAYSECDKEMQLSYFNRVIKKAKRGYMIYNKIAITDYGLDSLTKEDFVKLLKENGCKPRVSSELFAGAGNFLITWDKTKN